MVAGLVVPGSAVESAEGEWGGRGGGRHGGGYPQQRERPDGKKILERISKESGGRFLRFLRRSRSIRSTTRSRTNSAPI